MTTSAFTGQAVAAQPRQSAGPWTPWVLLLALAVFPWVAPLLQLEYYVGFVERLLIMMIAASSLNFILGYGGMVALGHAGFIGVGAYAVAVMVEAGHDSAWLIWATAIIAAAVFSALIGLVALRTRGVYFIMITLAFAEMLHYVAVSVRTYGGDDGYSIYSPLSLGAVFDGMEYGLYWVVLACAALLFALMSRISGSRFGHALKGARDNEVRMAAMGYPVFFIRLAAFVGAGAVAGLAGAMLATHDGFVSPSLMDWTQSAILIVMVVIGGVGNRWGGVIGAGLWLSLSLQEGLRMFTEYWHWPLGILLLIIVFYAPEGIAARLRRKRSAA